MIEKVTSFSVFMVGKVNRIKIHNKTLTLTVEEMYQLLDGEEKAFSGEICFNNCDVDLCKVLIFNKNLG